PRPALGIAANPAILSIVNGVLLRPLDYPDAERLMYVTTGQWPVSVPEYLEFQSFNRSFAELGAVRTGEVNLCAQERAWLVRSAIVDIHLLRALGLQLTDGRLFTSTDTVATAR